jgi:hypothetical protein
MARRRQARYRDTRTGHFVSRSTWKRSRAQGGTRYRRTFVASGRARRKPKPKGKRETSQVGAPTYEWLVSFTYKGTKRNVDILVTAKSDEEAERKAMEFLSGDSRGRHIASNISSWDIHIARGRISNDKESIYRSNSKQ